MGTLGAGREGARATSCSIILHSRGHICSSMLFLHLIHLIGLRLLCSLAQHALCTCTFEPCTHLRVPHSPPSQLPTHLPFVTLTAPPQVAAAAAAAKAAAAAAAAAAPPAPAPIPPPAAAAPMAAPPPGSVATPWGLMPPPPAGASAPPPTSAAAAPPAAWPGQPPLQVRLAVRCCA